MCISWRKHKKSSPVVIENANCAENTPPGGPPGDPAAGARPAVTPNEKKSKRMILSKIVPIGQVEKVQGKTPEPPIPRSPVLSATQDSAPRSKVSKPKSQPTEGAKADADQKVSDKNKKASPGKAGSEKKTEAFRLSQIDRPRQLKAKRTVEGTRAAKDPEYATLDNECPKFEEAILKTAVKKETPPEVTAQGIPNQEVKISSKETRKKEE